MPSEAYDFAELAILCNGKQRLIEELKKEKNMPQSQSFESMCEERNMLNEQIKIQQQKLDGVTENRKL